MTKKKRINYISWIYHKIKRRLPMILLMAGLNVAVSYANIQFALTTKTVVNSAIAMDHHLLTQSAMVMIGLSLFRLVGNSVGQFLMANNKENLERDFKHSVLHTILRCDYSRISNYHSGDLLQRMEADAATVFLGVMTMMSGLAGLIMSLVSAVIALLNIAPGFTVVCGAAAVVIGSTALLFRGILKQLSKDASAANGRVRGYFQEMLSRLMVIQALDLAPQVEHRSDIILDERWQIRKRQRNIGMISKFGTSAISYLSYLVTMLWCAWKLVNGQITYGDVMALTSLVSTVRSSAISLPKTLPRIFAITAACDRIMELENIPQQPDPDPEKVRSIYDTMTGFTARDLTFSYDRDPVMRQVSLTIPKGGLTVIVGPSGIGKSTLLKLLLGLYRQDSGSLVIDTPSGEIPVDRGTRALFTYAPQGNFLLSGTLRENLTYTNPQATDDELRQALYVSALDEYVATLPQGLDTVLRENGAGLSEGQAQRLSLARAILSGAPVLLLDEVTSALDAVTEKTVLERICALPGKTCIAVTHRPAALALADHIIEVTEEGMTLKNCE
ncbi:MAG: ABC transporter ATP-binding protein [Oscillospiraceae bacterium]|nr:ABC transporter ATP-binding protein [Oscillospiraceae bacterium]